jgi:hypothetical protein
MPLGLWKSKWEIHREDMARQRAEAERRSAEHDKKMARLSEESEQRSAEHREKMDRFPRRCGRNARRGRAAGSN